MNPHPTAEDVVQDRECFELLLSVFERCFCEKIYTTDRGDRLFAARESLNCPYYDLIVPAFDRSNFEKEDIASLFNIVRRPWHPSLYISLHHHPALVEQFAQDPGTEEKYLMRVPATISHEGAAIELLNDDTLDEAVSHLDISFPEYSDNRSYLLALCTESYGVENIHTFSRVASTRASFASLALTDRCGYLHNFCVLPEYRGKGVFGKHKSALLALLSERQIPLALSLNSLDRASLSANKRLGGWVADTVYHIPLPDQALIS